MSTDLGRPSRAWLFRRIGDRVAMVLRIVFVLIVLHHLLTGHP